MSRCRQQLVQKEQQKAGNYSLFQAFRYYTPESARLPLSAVNPPLPRRISAVFCTAFPVQIRRISATFPHEMHTIFIKKREMHFPQRFRRQSGGISGLGRREKWRKAGGEAGLRKSSSFAVGGASVCGSQFAVAHVSVQLRTARALHNVECAAAAAALPSSQNSRRMATVLQIAVCAICQAQTRMSAPHRFEVRTKRSGRPLNFSIPHGPDVGWLQPVRAGQLRSQPGRAKPVPHRATYPNRRDSNLEPHPT